MIETTQTILTHLQTDLCQRLEREESTISFLKDRWTHPMEKMGKVQGLTCVMENGSVIEKAGVNFSHVQGDALPEAATSLRPELKGCAFEAVGLSTVIHPRNPFVPTAHANLRLFVAQKPKPSEPIWWFGGGFDLTPYYGFDEDCQLWHQSAQKACDPFGVEVYARYKQACDDYFFLKHRNEARGIGGLFFDDLNHWEFETCLQFIHAVGEQFINAYLTILARRKNTAYTQTHRDFQCYRRGRYVEFNLLYDRGTAFGLHSGGRTESILISMPPQVTWRYDWRPLPGSPEAKLYEYYLVPKDWTVLDR